MIEKITDAFANIHRVVKTDEDLEWNRAVWRCTEIVQEAAKDGGREKINMEIKENTHIVIKREDAFKYLEETECQTLEELLCKIIRGRARDNKNPRNYYYIVNRDEPYAEIVKGVILGGEYAKSAPYQKGE